MNGMKGMANRLIFFYRDTGGNTVDRLWYFQAVRGIDPGPSLF
jgi:hypothetical protein